MLPNIFGENLFDDFFDDGFLNTFGGRNPLFGKHAKNMMKTDVRETDSTYEIDVDLPGFKKDEIKVDLENGYLTITANRSEDLDEKDNEGRYIRQERCTGSCARSFYVGENLKPTDVAAKFENGILELKLPKADKQIPEKPTTLIEIQ